LVSFIICFWIVRIIPKRSEACIFNCSRHQYDRKRKGWDDHHDREDTDYAQQQQRYQSQEDGNRQAAHETSSRTVDPKYSFCKDTPNNEAQSDRQSSCTTPQDLKIHSRTMERVHEQIDGFDGAEGFALESKVKRYHTNLERAKLEHDDIAKNRVKDGWDENVSIRTEETTDIIDSDIEMDDDDDAVDDDDYYYADNQSIDDDNEEDDDDKVQETEYDDQSIIYREASHAAATGDSFKLQEYLQQGHFNVLNVRDVNGWQIIHEVARSGDIDTMEIILSHVEYKDEMINVRTGPDGDGLSVVQLARELHGIDHPMVHYLRENGAV